MPEFLDGSRQGDPLGDMSFGFLIGSMLAAVLRNVKHAGYSVDLPWKSGLIGELQESRQHTFEAFGITYVDGIAVLMMGICATALLLQLVATMTIVYDVFRSSSLMLNLPVGKSKVPLDLRSVGATYYELKMFI